jgi:type II secretory pathway pseudopilin PulG
MKHSGFTLLETIIYCALFSILMTSAIVAVNALISSNSDTKTATSIVAEATFINQKLAWLFSGVSSVAQISTSTLQVVRSDLGTDSPLTINVLDNNIFITRNNSQAKPLTGLPFLITDVNIQYESQSVHISYSINDKEFYYQKNLQ